MSLGVTMLLPFPSCPCSVVSDMDLWFDMVYEWGSAAPRLSLSVLSLGYTYISGDHEVHHANCSAVMPLSGRTQSSSYALRSSDLTLQFPDP